MRYTSTKNERESDSKGSFSPYFSTKPGSMLKRLFLLAMMAICLTFAGAQSAPTATASANFDYVCGDPFIDPNDGQCYQMCCPSDPAVKAPCVLRPCGTR